MLALMATAVAVQAYAASAGTAETGPALAISDAEQTGAASAFLAAVAQTSNVALEQFRQWLGESYERAPALMLGLSVLLAVPSLALAGLLVRRRRHSPDATMLISRPSRRGGDTQQATVRTEVSAWPTEAWIEAVGAPGSRWVIGRTLLRIGREEDNDVCLSTHTVHRYHAVIRRTTDGEVMITDTSGAEGNGVLVNGASVAEARLAKGDTITVGTVKLRFDARPV